MEIVLLNMLCVFLTFYGMSMALDQTLKQKREELMAENRKIIDDIDKLLEDMKNS